MLQGLIASPALLNNAILRLCDVPSCLQWCSQAAQQQRAHKGAASGSPVR